MTATCFLSPAAEQDIEDVVTYIAQENPSAALAFFQKAFVVAGLSS